MEKKQGDVLLAGALVVLLLAGLFLNLNQWNGLQQERVRLTEQEQSLAAAQVRLAGLQALAKQGAKLANDLEIMEQLLPATAQEDVLLVDLQAGADLAAMRFAQIRFAERLSQEGQEGLVEMPLGILLEGSYHQLLHFLDYLSVYERAVRLDELMLSQGPEGMTINIRASAFYAAN
ncbi:MAG: hypothetical protein DDT34_01889 [Firmicutes bacterium]|nr:hypothetical protein [Bacillota bacterium]